VSKTAVNNVNWQQRATEFSVGDLVGLFGAYESQSGRVTAVWPAIGMVDVEMAVGNKRFPAEELQRYDNETGSVVPPQTDSAAVSPTVSVPGGPYKEASVQRVAEAAVRRALYWASKDRQYRLTGAESGGGPIGCPKCKDGTLKKAIYKRRDGASERLMGCPGCLFLIKGLDIVTYLGDHSELEVEAGV